jgi:hypothetical protein
MEDPSSHDETSDGVAVSDSVCPDEDRLRQIREARGRIQEDRLLEQNLQRHIIERSRLLKKMVRG